MSKIGEKCARCSGALHTEFGFRDGADITIALREPPAKFPKLPLRNSLLHARVASHRFCRTCSMVLLDMLAENGWMAWPATPAEGKWEPPDIRCQKTYGYYDYQCERPSGHPGACGMANPTPRCPECRHECFWAPWEHPESTSEDAASTWECYGCGRRWIVEPGVPPQPL